MTQRPEPAPAGFARVGGYRLIGRIGEGGMGVVHLAQRPGGERVALKVLRPAVVGDEEGRARLAREVSSLQRVHSPRIAEIVDADPWGATPYVATRYVPGLSLHQHIAQEGPIRGADLRYFATGLMEAVSAVHRVGVLHRDIKPSNVLLEGRAPVLIDFGLARLAEDPRLTHVGWLLGTPGYLAPEILYGEDATTASDVHAWAATVAFAAMGRPPFGNGPAVAVMDRVRRGEHDLSDVPADLRALVRTCLASDAGDRPTTEAVLATLRSPVGVFSDQPTAPYAATLPDPERTDRIDRIAGENNELPTGTLPTRGYTAPAPVQATRPQMATARATGATTWAATAWRPPPAGVPRLQRGLLLGGMLAVVTAAFVAEPYLAALAVVLLGQVVRTYSWTTEAAHLRQEARGRRRWFDRALMLSSAPWYLVVAGGGTAVLLGWAIVLVLLVALAGFVLGLPSALSLALMGLVFAGAVWWGPGARRLRVPVRRLVVVATTRRRVGWLADAVLAVVLALALYRLATFGTHWDPAPGAPWRPGTALGDLVRWL